MTASTNARVRMQTVVGEVRAYFAPVQRDTEAATVFDPNAAGFDLDCPPAPWIDLGWVRNLQRKATTALQSVRTGTAGVARLQFRQTTEAEVALDFCEWGKLQMTLAAGSQHMNVLASDGSQAGASGGQAIAGRALVPGSTAQELMLDANALASLAVGDLVAVDVDYALQVGYVGTGVAGAYVKDGSNTYDRDYIRRVTLNVARIAAKTTNSLQLAQPLLGGAPGATASVQKVVAFVDREGASFLQEWSAMFVLEPVSGGRISYYYPRLQTASAQAETMTALGEMQQASLHATFVALPVEDPVDGEQVVCYRTFVPDAVAAMY